MSSQPKKVAQCTPSPRIPVSQQGGIAVEGCPQRSALASLHGQQQLHALGLDSLLSRQRDQSGILFQDGVQHFLHRTYLALEKLQRSPVNRLGVGDFALSREHLAQRQVAFEQLLGLGRVRAFESLNELAQGFLGLEIALFENQAIGERAQGQHQVGMAACKLALQAECLAASGDRFIVATREHHQAGQERERSGGGQVVHALEAECLVGHVEALVHFLPGDIELADVLQAAWERRVTVAQPGLVALDRALV